MDRIEELTKKVLLIIEEKEDLSEEIIVGFLNEPLVLLEDMVKQSKRLKVHLVELKTLEFEVTRIASSIRVSKKGELKLYDKTGLYRLSLSTGGFIYLLKIRDSYQSEYTTLAFADEESWKVLTTIRRKIFKFINRPGKGIFKIEKSNYYESEIEYRKKNINHLPNIKIVHPQLEIIMKDIRYFMSMGYQEYERFNLSFFKKSLMYGKTGSGKTSINSIIAKQYCNDYNISFIEDFSALIKHLESIEYYNIPSIVIYEDCERDLYKANGEVLNFLDGIDMPYFKQPVYLIASTNYPQKLEERIRRRFDSIFHIGPLTGEFALECARIYFGSYFEFNDEDHVYFNGLTGSEISKIWFATRDLCKNNGEMITLELVREIIEKLRKEFKLIEKEDKNNRMGFLKEVPF